MTSPTDLRELAVGVAVRAGRLLVEERPAGLDPSTKSSPTDVVTVMDRAAEALLVDALLAERPDDGVLGEEGARGEGVSGVRWVLDPLDGTVNYLHGSPLWAVSVAAELHGRTVAGAVYAPALGEMFAGAQGEGATLNGGRLSVAAEVPLSQAVIGTGLCYDSGQRALQGRVLGALAPDVADIRRSGSAALDVCWVACGRLEAYYEHVVNRWDVAAAGLIAAEAGASVSGLAAPLATSELTSAATPGLSGPLQRRLAELTGSIFGTGS